MGNQSKKRAKGAATVVAAGLLAMSLGTATMAITAGLATPTAAYAASDRYQMTTAVEIEWIDSGHEAERPTVDENLYLGCNFPDGTGWFEAHFDPAECGASSQFWHSTPDTGVRWYDPEVGLDAPSTIHLQSTDPSTGGTISREDNYDIVYRGCRNEGEYWSYLFEFTYVGHSGTYTVDTGSQQGGGEQGGGQQSSSTQGSLTINQNSMNEGTTYDAYKVFDAAIAKSGNDYKASALDWANNTTKGAVLGFLASWDADGNGTSDYDEWLTSRYGAAPTSAERENPQNAAEFIASLIGTSANDSSANTTPPTKQAGTFAADLAKALRGTNGLSADATITAGTAATLDQGYYLVATTDSTLSAGEVGSAPMWIPVSDTALTITEKTSVPTFDKQVLDDADGAAYGKIADASIGQDLGFKMTAVVPSNVAAFDTYPMAVADTLPAGMALSSINDVHVSLAGVDITEYLDGVQTMGDNRPVGSISYANNVLAVSVADVRWIAEELYAASIYDAAGTSLVITYDAHLTTSANRGDQAGNMNAATLTYAADPTNATTSTLTSGTQVLTYQVELDKVDKQTRQALDNASFTASTEIGGTTYYVKSDGTLTTNSAEAGTFTTSGGALTISGIDEGVYTLHETAAPSGYRTIASDITLTITAAKDASSGTLTTLTATATGGEGMVSNPSASEDGVVSATPATGAIVIRVSDPKEILMPLTGLPLDQALLILGGVIATASVVAFAVRRKRGDDDEYEWVAE